MTGWGDDSVLVELVERQFAHLLSLTGTARLLFVTRLLAFIEGEPRLSAILQDLHCQALEVLSEFRRTQERIRSALRSHWAKHAADLRPHLLPAEADPNRARFVSPYASVESYEDRLAAVSAPEFPAVGKDTPLDSDTEDLIFALLNWQGWVATGANGVLPDGLERLERALEGLRDEHRLAVRSLQLATRTLAWPALERLRKVRTLSQPAPPARGAAMTAESLVDFARFDNEDKVARVLHGEANPTPDGQRDVASMVDEVASDAKTLREELVLRIGIGRSRISLVRRYAARCEAFDAERLRAACEEASSHAERILTLDFARFLFDAGLTPLLEATASGLRPDVLHLAPSSLFYVEAKQYDGTGAKAQLRKAYAQVWSTWARLRKIYPCDEAFLVVFRRGGPYVELPAVIRWAGLRLYSVVADISTEAGSREKTRVELITESDLQPAPEEEK